MPALPLLDKRARRAFIVRVDDVHGFDVLPLRQGRGKRHGSAAPEFAASASSTTVENCTA